MAVAKDGSIYVTDWVDRSYPVHRKGRLWRLSRTKEAAPISGNLPEKSPAEIELQRLESDASMSLAQRMSALNDEDPFVRQAAIAGLIQTGQLMSVSRDDAESAWQRIGLLTAWRWLELSSPESVSAATRKEWIDWGLADDSQQVEIAAIRWATERGLVEYLDTIRSLLDRPSLSPQNVRGGDCFDRLSGNGVGGERSA